MEGPRTALPPVPARLRELLRHFGTGEPRLVARAAEGLLNRGYRVDTTTGRYFLKEYTDPGYASAATVLAQHRATLRLHGLGLPVPPPLTGAAGGSTLLELDGSRYALYPWVEGRHRHGTELAPEQCSELGRLLATVHRALDRADPPPADPPAPETADAAHTDRLIGDLLELAGRGASDAFDRDATRRLRERRALLEEYADRRPDPAGAPPTGWVHGDFHPLNVLYAPGRPPQRLAAVLDWDRLSLRPQAEEMVRAATLFFQDRRTGVLDLPRVRRYARAYRRASGLSPEQAAAAVHRVWWERLNDFWMLEWRYHRNDRRADPLFPAAAGQIVWWCAEYGQVLDACAN